MSNNPNPINRSAFDKSGLMDATLDRAGLESIGPRDEATAPELLREGERVWLSIVVGGRREKICEVSLFRVLRLNRQAAEIAEALAGR